ncbi:MAG: tetratricopeptide repeat protein [Chloroflexi bacterium]|nr:tetratricopeptide repeat protein [Chloroflexota bacterium]
MASITQRFQPVSAGDGEADPLLQFARSVAPLLDVDFTASEDQLDESVIEDPGRKRTLRRRYGDESRGFRVVLEQELEEGAEASTADKVLVTAYGLPPDISLEIERSRDYFEPRFVELRASGPDETILQQIKAQFEASFKPEERSLTVEELTQAIASIRAAIRAGRWPAVEIRARQVLDSDPAEAEALFALGVARAAQGDLEVGAIYLKETLEADPEHYDALYNLGLIHINQGLPELAIDFLQRSLQIEPENHPVYYQLGKANEDAGRLDEALAAYQESLRLAPNPELDWNYTGMDLSKWAKEAVERVEALAKAAAVAEELSPVDAELTATEDPATDELV